MEQDPLELLVRAATQMPAPGEFKVIVARSKEAASVLAARRAQAAKQLPNLIGEIRLGGEQVSVQLNPTELETLLGIQIIRGPIKVDIIGRLKRNGHSDREVELGRQEADCSSGRKARDWTLV